MTGWWTGLPFELKGFAVLIGLSAAAWLYALAETIWRDR